MVRRFNYTGRQRIRREDITIQITGDGPSPPSFAAQLRLDGYDLPASARVFVEAYRQTSWQRFDFGTLGEIREPRERRLSAFGSPDGILFRLKIVEAARPDSGRRPGRILAQADRIHPRLSDEGKRRSLLPLDSGDFRDEVWQLEFDDTDAPVLKVSRDLVPDWRSLPHTRQFITLALPAILRCILTHILSNRPSDPEDFSDWRNQWLRFTVTLRGVSSPPQEDEAAESWIDDAVQAFCRHAGIARRFREWWEQKE